VSDMSDEMKVVLMAIAVLVAMGGALVYALRVVVNLLARVLGQHLANVEKTFNERAAALAEGIEKQAAAAEKQAESLDALVAEVGAIRLAMVEGGNVVPIARPEPAAPPAPRPPPPPTSIPGPGVMVGGRR
jgi:hypothetical protein